MNERNPNPPSAPNPPPSTETPPKSSPPITGNPPKNPVPDSLGKNAEKEQNRK